MTPHIPDEFSTRLIDWSPFVIVGNTMNWTIAGKPLLVRQAGCGLVSSVADFMS
jgi:hypothetical protein